MNESGQKEVRSYLTTERSNARHAREVMLFNARKNTVDAVANDSWKEVADYYRYRAIVFKLLAKAYGMLEQTELHLPALMMPFDLVWGVPPEEAEPDFGEWLAGQGLNVYDDIDVRYDPDLDDWVLQGDQYIM